MSVRDVCTTDESKTVNLTQLHKKEGSVCRKTFGDSQDVHDLKVNSTVMAVWSFSVPANQCFKLSFLLRLRRGQKDNYQDKLTIQDRQDLVLTVLMKPGVFHYSPPPHNETTTVSVVYYYKSFSNKVYWRMATSINCSCDQNWYILHSYSYKDHFVIQFISCLFI